MIKKKNKRAPSLPQGVFVQRNATYFPTRQTPPITMPQSQSPTGKYGAAYQNFDLVGCTRKSIERAIDEKGLKVLLLDSATEAVVSMTYSFNEMLAKDVYLIDQISNTKRQRQGHLKAIIFVQPTDENCDFIEKELRDPMYGSYYLFFTNIAENHILERLAQADDRERVQQVHEVYSDFLPIHPYAFSCNINKPLLLDSEMDVSRVCDTLVGVLLSVRRDPWIRYQASSPACTRLANFITRKTQSDTSLFEFRRSADCVLLILDRRDDLITPILTQWTYEAMVHQHYGINHHKCQIPGEDAMNLIPLYDPFWTDNLHSNWGEVCQNVKKFVDTYKAKTHMQDDTANLEDIKKFMDKMPELRKESVSIGKHATIAACLGKLIKGRELMRVSGLEQEISCTNNHKEHVESLNEIFTSPEISASDCVNLLTIYALRWEKHREHQTTKLAQLLCEHKDISQHDVTNTIQNALRYGGAQQRCSDLFDEEKKLSNFLRHAVKGMQEVENIYTQHEPLLKKTLMSIFRRKLSTELFPYISTKTPPSGKDFKPKEVIVFIVGGMTSEETKCVKDCMDELNKEAATSGHKIILGGTDMLRTNEVMNALSR
eukprot:TRINITY_DN4861_c0_g1_i1.p1 TRINITY_DN4861_c0_g1~~TRINITY_DN4861_c0_g1_i1.p1  ORF type:complete len:601 (+),score=93.71 TRINITY_DN4861_c0_g1_i1:1595-3397(+)